MSTLKNISKNLQPRFLKSAYGTAGQPFFQIFQKKLSSEVESHEQQDVVVVGYARTPFGSFLGELSTLSSINLASVAMKGALKRAGVKPESVEEVILGNVLNAGLGNSPAKKAAIAAGLPPNTVCWAVNQGCSSGLKAVTLAARSISLGLHQVVLAVGADSASLSPYLLPRRLPQSIPSPTSPHLPIIDSLAWDGTWAPQASSVESLCRSMSISRDDQDDFAIESFHRAASAQATGILATEICALDLSPTHRASADEDCTRFDPERVRTLPATHGGSLTAGNSSSPADGAAAVLLTSAKYARDHDIPILAHVLGWADVSYPPEDSPLSPAKAIPRAVRSARVDLGAVQVFELAESSAGAVLACQRLLGVDSSEMNLQGGCVALGQPMGAVGTRLTSSLLTSLALSGHSLGVAAVGDGGGGASAILLRREDSFRLWQHSLHHWTHHPPPPPPPSSTSVSPLTSSQPQAEKEGAKTEEEGGKQA